MARRGNTFTPGELIDYIGERGATQEELLTLSKLFKKYLNCDCANCEPDGGCTFFKNCFWDQLM